MTSLSRLLFKYLAKEFFKKFVLFLTIFMGVVYLFETIELIRRASGEGDIPITSILALGLYKLPDVGEQILPFITLFAAIGTFRALTDRQELVSIRSAGISVWQFIIPIVTVTFTMGLVYITILHPLASASIARYEALSNVYFKDGVETISMIDDGIWLRQADETGNFILKAKGLDATTWTMRDVTVFFFDNQGVHLQRIDAKSATLEPNQWAFQNVSIFKTGDRPVIIPEFNIQTNLTAQTIAESFSSYKTISFWRLPFFINALGETGLDTTEIRAYYQTLLSTPLLLIAMVVMAAAITLRTERISGLLPVITGALGFGFIAFFFSGFLRALSLGDEIPMVLGLWAPSIIILLTAISFLIRLEDG